MSNRTVQADKAIRKAWQKEQDLVRDGKGTRDWTPEQQQDILSSGKAYDENGKAFHGQHMKSVEKYPEYQGDPDNIQFLTKDEHFVAHGGSWQNPTNWYYNPVTMEKTDFGDGPCIPCEIIDLSELYIPIPEEVEIIEDGTDIPEKAEIAEETDVAPPDASDRPSAKAPKTAPAVCPKKRSLGQVLKQAGKSTVAWFTEHPGVVTVLKVSAATVGTYVISKIISDGSGSTSENSGNGSGNGYDNSDSYSSDSYDDYSSYSEPEPDPDPDATDDSDSSSETEDGRGKGTPKAPHDTSGYTRTRYGKEEHVSGYSTGKNREEAPPDEDSSEE